MHLQLISVAAALLIGSVSAQYTVSPAANANVQGNAADPYPLSFANGRSQQIHGDLRGTPLVLRGITATHPDILVPFNAAWVGVHLYAQAATADPGQPGIPLALSDGMDKVLPSISPPASAAPIVRIFEGTSTTAVVGTVNYYSYGLIVRFTN